jgi:hypothetical protein
MTRLRAFFESTPWTSLRPAQHRLAEQPGAADPRRFIAVAQTPDAGLTVAYLPMGGTVQFAAAPAGRASWVDPRTGESRAAGSGADGADGRSFVAPDEGDWIFAARR